jgi:hypothetical protein
MQTIYKYQLRPQEGTSSITVGMPRDAKILSVGTQVGRLGRGEYFYVWAEIDTNVESTIHEFEIYRPGHELSIRNMDNRKFIGTVFFKSHPLVFHVYDIGEVK